VRRGDVLVAVDGTDVRTRRDFYEIARSLTVEQNVKLALDRAGQRTRVEVRAEKFPETRADEFAQILLGLELAERSAQLARKYGIDSPRGLFVSSVVPHSAAQSRGLRPGDLILQIGRERVDDRTALRRAIPKILGQDGVVVVVQRGRQYGSVMLELW
jgi:S1-C subfamily serine protease